MLAWKINRLQSALRASSMAQIVRVPIVGRPACSASYQQLAGATRQIIGPGMLCFGLVQGGKDACQGDSGNLYLLIQQEVQEMCHME